MDFNGGQHNDGPPAKKIRLSPEPSSMNDFNWTLVNQFNSELPEELGTLQNDICMSNGVSSGLSNADISAIQTYDQHLSPAQPSAVTLLQSSTVMPSSQPPVLNTVTAVVSAGSSQFQPALGKLPQVAILTSSTSPNIGSIMVNLASTTATLVSSIGNILTMQRPHSNMMAVVTANRPAGTTPQLQFSNSTMQMPNSAVGQPLLRSTIPNRLSLPLNRMIVNVVENQQTMTLPQASVTQIPNLVGIQRKPPGTAPVVAASTGNFTVPLTNMSVPQLGILAKGNGLSVQPLAAIQVSGQQSNAANSTASQAPLTTSADSEKCRLIQQQLVLLLHAHKCQRREQEIDQLIPCPLPHCQTMKDVLKHMGECVLGKACKVPHCASSRQIISHWKNCARNDCSVCLPLKTHDRKGGVSARLVPSGTSRSAPSNSGTSIALTSTSHSDMVRTYLTIGLSPPGMHQQEVPVGNLASVPCTATTTTAAVSGNHSWMLSKQHLGTVASCVPETAPAVMNVMKPNTPQELGIPAETVSGDGLDFEFGTITEVPGHRAQSWHADVTPDLRNHLVFKLVQAIFPTPDPMALRDKRISHLVQYARKVEGDMYETANSREEYYHFLAEKIYKIQKDLEEKRRRRVLDRVGLGGGESSGNILPTSQGLASPRPLLPGANIATATAAVGQIASADDVINRVIGAPSLPSSGTADAISCSGNFSTSINQLTRVASSGSNSIMQAQQLLQNALAKHKVQMDQKPLLTTDSNASSSSASAESAHTAASMKLFQQHLASISQQQQLKAFSLHNNSPSPGTVLMHASLTTPSSASDVLASLKSTEINSVSSLLPQQPKHVSAESKTEATYNSYLNVDIPMEVKYESLEDKQTDMFTKKTDNLKDSLSHQGDSSLSGIKMETEESAVASSAAHSQKPMNKKNWKLNELRQSLMPVLENLYRMEPESLPFRQPVDPIQLMIPDYFEIIKKPMDLSTIKRKLDTGQYTDPWQFVDDVWLMFDNAWLYNRKSSKVHKFCSKLADAFEVDIDRVMKALGFCCGRKYVFCPQVLCCYGKPMCTISVNAVYYSFQNRYVYCEKCFIETEGEEIELVEDPSQPSIRIKRELFIRTKNSDLEPELFVVCTYCGRKQHQVCVLYMEQMSTADFVCDVCSVTSGIPKRVSKYTAKKLPQTKMGSYLENRVNSFLKKRDADAGEVVIRVLSSSEKVVEVKPGMKVRYSDSGEFPDSFPYVAKAIFAFEEIDGVDVCFFGMHVQEYGSSCTSPNTRRVYLAYLDSVHFFQPRQLRTSVYHEILIGYLDYVKTLGYVTAHIWACPPGEGDDYIFHCHPPDMKIPKSKRLQDWYKKMLDKAIIERVVIDYKDVLRDAKEGNIQDVTEIPYFEGDFWPNILEESIKVLELEEEDKRKREEVEATAGVEMDELKLEGEEIVEVSQTGKKKGQKGVGVKKKNTKNKASANRKSGKKCGQLYAGNDLTQKLFTSMDKHKEVFFVVRLHSSQAAAALPPIRDPDPFVASDLMDGRDNFLMMAREKHYEFSSLRRVKFSTMAMLYELHNQGRDNFVYTCNSCKANIETHYHCNTCDDFDLCIPCYKKEQHPHPMEKRGLDIDEGGSSEDKQLSPGESRRLSIQRCIQSLYHACQCCDLNCQLPSCQKMKRVMSHTKLCRRKTNGGCPVCKQLIALCCYHAKNCSEPICPVPFCIQIRQKLQQQQMQQRCLRMQLMRRRMAAMQRVGAGTSVFTAPTQAMPMVQSHVSEPAVSGKPSELLTNCGADKPAVLAAQKMDMIAHHQPASVAMLPVKNELTLGQKAFATMPAVSQVQVGGTSDTYEEWKKLLAASQSGLSVQINEPAPVMMATASTSSVTAPSSADVSQSPQHRLVLQKLFAALRASGNNQQQQQQVLKILKSHPPLLAAFVKQKQMQAQAQNQRRAELEASVQMASVAPMAVSSGIQEIGNQVSTINMAPPVQGTLNIATGAVGRAQVQTRMINMASSQGIISTCDGKVSTGDDQTRMTQFSQHPVQQFSLQQLQQLHLQRSSSVATTLTGVPTLATGATQNPRLRMNSNVVHQQVVSNIGRMMAPASNCVSQPQPVVMVTLNQRLPGGRTGPYQIQGTNAITVGQNLTVLHGVPTPRLTAGVQQTINLNRPMLMPSQYNPNPTVSTHQTVYSQLQTLHGHSAGIVLPDRTTSSTDQLMLSQLQSSYKPNLDFSSTLSSSNGDDNLPPLTPQDQLSRYVEQL